MSGTRSEIAVADFRPIVEEWIAGFNSPEEAFQLLATRSGEKADSWRRRFSTDKHRWWANPTISTRLVDQFLTLAELPHLYSALDPVMWQPEARKRCGHCKTSQPTTNFSRDKNRLDGFACWCRACKAASQRRYRQANLERERAKDRERTRLHGQRTANRRPPTARRIRPRREDARMTSAQIAATYRLYAAGLSTIQLGEKLWRRFGFPRPVSCRNALVIAFHKDGYALRSRSEACRLQRQRQRAATA